LARTTHVIFGQFSRSPVLAAATTMGIDVRHGLEVATQRVLSSPGQFAALRANEIDVAITSPDNVLLYGTTARNPLGEQLPVRMVRAVDRGLGLGLFTQPSIATTDDLHRSVIGVDVVQSGFAMLLFAMLSRLGVPVAGMEFPEIGSTPLRLESLRNKDVDGTILNAESRIGALRSGMRVWSTSADVTPNYLGTVLAVPASFDPQLAQSLTHMWDESTQWLLEAPEADVVSCLGQTDAVLGSTEYVRLVRDSSFGLVGASTVAIADLRALTAIRRGCGAYAPEDSALHGLVGL
jgi:ABC-type nitrate/sulfonate/bicarbonate transport system substrate-binding protein